MCGPDGRSTDATYQIKYNVVQMRTGLQSLHQVLAVAMATGRQFLRVDAIL